MCLYAWHPRGQGTGHDHADCWRGAVSRVMGFLVISCSSSSTPIAPVVTLPLQDGSRMENNAPVPLATSPDASLLGYHKSCPTTSRGSVAGAALSRAEGFKTVNVSTLARLDTDGVTSRCCVVDYAGAGQRPNLPFRCSRDAVVMHTSAQGPLAPDGSSYRQPYIIVQPDPASVRQSGLWIRPPPRRDDQTDGIFWQEISSDQWEQMALFAIPWTVPLVILPRQEHRTKKKRAARDDDDEEDAHDDVPFAFVRLPMGGHVHRTSSRLNPSQV